MSSTRTVVFLHGMGESAQVWDEQRAGLPEEYDSLAVELLGPADSDRPFEFTLDGAVQHVLERIRPHTADRVHLCGAALGAMVALQFALDHPQRVRSLTLAAGLVKPMRVRMAIHGALFRLLPASALEQRGSSKDLMLSVMRVVGRTDFSHRLGDVSVPTLVLCGENDRPGMPAAQALASGIRGARLQVVPGAGHRSHADAPEAFQELLEDFLARV